MKLNIGLNPLARGQGVALLTDQGRKRYFFLLHILIGISSTSSLAYSLILSFIHSLPVMAWVSVTFQNSPVETLSPNMTVLESGAFFPKIRKKQKRLILPLLLNIVQKVLDNAVDRKHKWKEVEET